MGRIAVALAGLLALSACAFTPLYGPEGPGTALDGKVDVAAPATTRNFVLARELQRAFGPATDPAFRLDYALAVASEEAAITSGQEIDRVNLIGTMTYTLRALPGAEPVAAGVADGFVSYSSAGDPIATNAARQDAELRLARIIAERTVVFVLTDPAVSAAAAAAP